MPIQSTVEQANKTIVSRATGHITLQDLTDHFASVWVGPQNAGFSEIFDWTDVDHIDLSVAELRNFAGPANAFYDDSSPSKLAIITTGRRGTRMAQLYRNFREMRGGKDPEIQVFSDMASARVWLGIP
jgi:hypothetical protein